MMEKSLSSWNIWKARRFFLLRSFETAQGGAVNSNTSNVSPPNKKINDGLFVERNLETLLGLKLITVKKAKKITNCTKREPKLTEKLYCKTSML